MLRGGRRISGDELAAHASALIPPAIWGIALAPLLLAGLPHLPEVVADPGIRAALIFSLEESLLASAVAVALGVPLGYVNATFEYRGRRLVEALTLLPFTMPTVSVALAFLLIVRSGLLPPGLTSISLANAYFNFGFCASLVSSSLLPVGRRLEEAAQVMGASRRMIWRRIIVPLTLRGVSHGFALTFVLSFTSFAVPLLLGGPGSRTLEVEIYSLYKVFLDGERASAAALLQLAVTMILALLLTRRVREARSLEVRRRRPAGMRVVLLPYALAIMSAYPMAYLVLRSLYNPFTGRLSPIVYFRLLSPSYDPVLGISPLRPVVNSLYYAVMTALISLTLSSVLLLSRRALRLADFLSIPPLGTSSITLALGFLLLSSRAGIPGWIAMILSHFLIAFPFSLRMLESGVGGLSPHLMEAAETLGLSRLDAVFRVILPAAMPAVLSSAFYSLAISLSETSASALLSTPETMTLTVAALHYSSARRFQMASAASVVVMGLTWLFLWLMEAVESRLRWLREGAGGE